MDVTLGLLADAANTTADGRLNILGVFNRLNAEAFPVTYPRMVLVLTFEANSAEWGTEKEILVRFVDADGQRSLDIQIRLTVPHSHDAGRPVEWSQVATINGLQIKEPGDHAFVVLVNGETKRRVPLLVRQQQARAAGSAP